MARSNYESRSHPFSSRGRHLSDTKATRQRADIAVEKSEAASLTWRRRHVRGVQAAAHQQRQVFSGESLPRFTAVPIVVMPRHPEVLRCARFALCALALLFTPSSYRQSPAIPPQPQPANIGMADPQVPLTSTSQSPLSARLGERMLGGRRRRCKDQLHGVLAGLLEMGQPVAEGGHLSYAPLTEVASRSAAEQRRRPCRPRTLADAPGQRRMPVRGLLPPDR